MQSILGMILGAVLVIGGAYVVDSIRTSTIASGPDAQTNRTIVNWDVVASDWNSLKAHAHDDWVRISSK